jgi:hypothetical protein
LALGRQALPSLSESVLCWLGWRAPTLLFLIVLASLAVRPEVIFGGSEIGYDWGWQRTLLGLVLIVNGSATASDQPPTGRSWRCLPFCC